MKRILTCPPTYYDIEYEINPWMHVENKVNKTQVAAVYTEITALYKNLGVEVYEIEPVQGLPDMVYTANVGYLHNNTFIKANFKFPQRRREANVAQQYLENRIGCKTVTLPDTIFFEGQGDLLTDGKRFFFGWGKRSDKQAKELLEEYLHTSVIDFELVNPYYYHLDTCFAPLEEDLVIINPESFTSEGKKKVYDSFKNVIETNKQDNSVIACNLVKIGEHIVIGRGISEELRKKIAGYGYTAHEIDMKEYIKGGGSVKCCSFEF